MEKKALLSLGKLRERRQVRECRGSGKVLTRKTEKGERIFAIIFLCVKDYHLCLSVIDPLHKA
jgi:hypothetical protein